MGFMRKSLYAALVRLPFKIGGGIGWTIGLLSAAIPTKIEKIAGYAMSAGVIQAVGIALLALSAPYFAVLWLLKPSARDVNEKSKTTFNIHSSTVNYLTIEELGNFPQVNSEKIADLDRFMGQGDEVIVNNSPCKPQATEPQTPLVLEGLYVGRIFVAAGHLIDGQFLEMGVTAFNGSGVAITIVRIEGRIFEVSASGDGDTALASPAWVAEHTPRFIPNKTEFHLLFQQKVEPVQREKFLEAFEKGGVKLKLDQFSVIVQDVGDPLRTTRLPLWPAISVLRRDDIVTVPYTTGTASIVEECDSLNATGKLG